MIAKATARARGSSRARRGSTRPSWRPTCATRPISGWRADARGRWRARPQAAGWPGAARRGCRDRSRAIAGRLRQLPDARARTGQGKRLALRLTGEAGELVARSIARGAAARRPAARARARPRRARQAARGRAAGAAGRARREGRAADQPARSRARRSPTGWSRSATPTRARSARASCGKPTEFGYVMQLTELSENTRRGARGLILPASTGSARPTSPTAARHRPPSSTARHPAARDRARRRLPARPVADTCPTPERCSSPAATSPAPQTNRRLARFRVGAEGRISHLKRRYGLRRIAPQRPRRRADLDRLGRSSPTTSTRSPSEPPDSIPASGTTRPDTRNTETAAPSPRRGRSHSSAAVYPGQVASYP